MQSYLKLEKGILQKKKNLVYNFEIEKEIVKNNRLKFFDMEGDKLVGKEARVGN